MADMIDNEIEEQAVRAFEELDEWDAAIGSDDEKREPSGGPATVSAEASGTVVLGTPEVAPLKTPRPVKVQDAPDAGGNKMGGNKQGTGKQDWPASAKAKMILAHYTREQAKELTRPEYDDFDDVVSGGAVSPARLAEYTSSVPFFYKAVRTKEEKMGWLPKYPGFLALFGVTDPSKISVSDVFRKFDPKGYSDAMESEEEGEKLARAGSVIIAQRGLDFGRELDESDYAILKRFGVKNPEKYRTVAQVTGMDSSAMRSDPGSNAVYTKEYRDAMEEAFGKDDGAPETEVVSLDDIMAGLDPNIARGFLGKRPDEIHAVKPEYETVDDEGDSTGAPAFVPFSRDSKPSPDMSAFARAAMRTKAVMRKMPEPGNPW